MYNNTYEDDSYIGEIYDITCYVNRRIEHGSYDMKKMSQEDHMSG